MILLLLLLVFFPAFTIAQAVCNSTYTWYFWAKDDFNNDPCQIASNLLQQCPGKLTLPALVPSNNTALDHYPGPTADTQSPCSCSNIVYNLVAACGDCQVGNVAPTAWPSYQTWSNSCVSSSLGNNFNYDLSRNVSIPIWATVNATDTEDSHWSFGLSYALARGLVVLANSTIPTSAPTPIPLPAGLNAFKTCISKGTLAGVAIGTAVGGFLLAVLIFFGVAFLRRRREHRLSKSEIAQPIIKPPTARTHSSQNMVQTQPTPDPTTTNGNGRPHATVEPYIINAAQSNGAEPVSRTDRKANRLASQSSAQSYHEPTTATSTTSPPHSEHPTPVTNTLPDVHSS